MILPAVPDNLENLPKLREYLATLVAAIEGKADANQDMGGHKIINLGDPTNPTDAANKEYVDATDLALSNTISTLDAQNIKKNGSVAFAADESMGGHKLTNVATPTTGSDAANKAYVDGSVPSGLQVAMVSFSGSGNIDVPTGFTPKVAIVIQGNNFNSGNSGNSVGFAIGTGALQQAYTSVGQCDSSGLATGTSATGAAMVYETSCVGGISVGTITQFDSTRVRLNLTGGATGSILVFG